MVVTFIFVLTGDSETNRRELSTILVASKGA
jgi:hypothetical protein